MANELYFVPYAFSNRVFALTGFPLDTDCARTNVLSCDGVEAPSFLGYYMEQGSESRWLLREGALLLQPAAPVSIVLSVVSNSAAYLTVINDSRPASVYAPKSLAEQSGLSRQRDASKQASATASRAPTSDGSEQVGDASANQGENCICGHAMAIDLVVVQVSSALTNRKQQRR